MGEVIKHPVVDAGYTHLPPGAAGRAAQAALDKLDAQTAQRNRKREWIAAGIGVCAFGAFAWGMHDLYEMLNGIFTHTAPKNGYKAEYMLPLSAKMFATLAGVIVAQRMIPRLPERLKRTVGFGSKTYVAAND